MSKIFSLDSSDLEVDEERVVFQKVYLSEILKKDHPKFRSVRTSL